MRGEDDSPLAIGQLPRITPACAGRRFCSHSGRSSPWDHPRVCGEKMTSGGRELGKRGSPPRVRGEGRRPSCCLALRRITPACAGRSHDLPRPTHRTTDHPRVCGEKLLSGISGPRPRGSPPRTRGEGDTSFTKHHAVRITPACAGRSLVSATRCGLSADHPRVCGEKGLLYVWLLIGGGSPPRVRGEVRVSLSLTKYSGITPACAGRSRKRAARGLAGPDHPRVRGEKLLRVNVKKRSRGSPPRARGEVLHYYGCESNPRITPACAGRRPDVRSMFTVMKDHPRVRGEK